MLSNDEYKGSGWYRIGFSDSGMDWTSDGPIWIDDPAAFEEEARSVATVETEAHLAYADYLGDGEEPQEQD